MHKFFLTGPNRTGTSLLARCIDDHSRCICLFESNAHVAMFGGTSTMGHSGRMKRNGFEKPQTTELIQRSNKSLLGWYDNCADILKDRFQKPDLTHIGDKNPYFHIHDIACKSIAKCPKIWTIRDPRSVWFSKKPGHYFSRYLDNVRHFFEHQDDTSLVIRFEDLIAHPASTMHKVYEFIEVEYDNSFFVRSKKPYDGRFKWNPNSIDPFDTSKIDTWKREHKLPKKFFTTLVKDIMSRFDYK